MPLQITRTTAIALRARPLRTIEKVKLAWLTTKCVIPAWALGAAYLWLTYKPGPQGLHGPHGLHYLTLGDKLAESGFLAALMALVLFLVFYGVCQHLVYVPSFDTEAYGSARLATHEDIATAKLLTQSGIFLGFAQNPKAKRNTLPPMLRYREDAHLITVAPSGTGKFRDLLAVAIMLHEHSLIVIDPKGQAACVTARGRRELGHKTVVLNPFDMYKDRLGPSASYNPMDTLDPSAKSFGADCDRIADGIVVHNERDNNPHFNDAARSLVAGVIRYLAKYESNPTLRNPNVVRAVIAGPTALLQSFCKQAVRTGDLHIANQLARFCSFDASNKEITDVIATAITQTNFLNNDAISESVAQSSFRFSDLRREPMTVYITLPSSYLDTCGKWFRFMVAGALHELIREESPGQLSVLMVLDEFAHLGRMNAITTAMGLGRGYHLQVWPILQSLVQLRDLYGPGWEGFLSAAGVRQFYAPRDHFTGSEIEKLAGVSSAATMSQNHQGVITPYAREVSAGGNFSFGHVARPLLYADEIMKLGPDRQLLFVHDCPAIRGSRMPYYDRQMGKFRLKGRPLASYFDADPQHPT